VQHRELVAQHRDFHILRVRCWSKADQVKDSTHDHERTVRITTGSSCQSRHRAWSLPWRRTCTLHDPAAQQGDVDGAEGVTVTCDVPPRQGRHRFRGRRTSATVGAGSQTNRPFPPATAMIKPIVSIPLPAAELPRGDLHGQSASLPCL
jgi:hypothetical protein